uniref:Uncharacterized protein n=1 Tax=Setaria viridis TaxID=4556 RepID=A0A4U6SSL1_SETVI|nr:hypothetical protein SEVIR_9G103233v2 [Setaria viridis]
MHQSFYSRRPRSLTWIVFFSVSLSVFAAAQSRHACSKRLTSPCCRAAAWS